MRIRIALFALFAFYSAFFMTWTVARGARASDCSGVVTACIDDDTLWPHAGPALFEAVGSGQTIASGRIGFGLVTSYLSRPIVLQLVSPGNASGGTVQDAVNDQVNGTFLWAYGVTDRLELDLALPLTFGQGGTGLAPVTGGTGLRDTAVRDLRFGLAYAIVPFSRAPAPEPEAERESAGALVARFEVGAPTGDDDQFASEGAGVFVPSVAGEYRVSRWFAGAEVGARVRPIRQLLGARVGTQLVTSLGVGVEILPRELLSAEVEAWALPTFAAQGTPTVVNGAYAATLNDDHILPAEWQLSGRSAPLRTGDLSIELGGGGGIPFAGDLPVTSPRFRFTLGLRWEAH
jgi:OmpA-OmpF porin, OOP family